AVQRTSRRGERIHAAFDRGVVDQRWSMVRLDPGIDHQRACTAPVFLLGERADAINIRGGIRARECHPDEIPQTRRDEITVVNDDDEREFAYGTVFRQRPAERRDFTDGVSVSSGLDGQHPWQNHAWLSEPVGQTERRKLGWKCAPHWAGSG